MIIPDMPFEEKGELQEFTGKYDLKLISLIAPTSQERIQMIAKEAEGFIYVVSSLGVTGVRDTITTDVGQIIDMIRQVTDVPTAVGFGINKPEQVHQYTQIADGAIVGQCDCSHCGTIRRTGRTKDLRICIGNGRRSGRVIVSD